jgi:hypothetical protein
MVVGKIIETYGYAFLVLTVQVSLTSTHFEHGTPVESTSHRIL